MWVLCVDCFVTASDACMVCGCVLLVLYLRWKPSAVYLGCVAFVVQLCVCRVCVVCAACCFIVNTCAHRGN